MNTAVTPRGVSIVTVHVPVPPQAEPDHPMNVMPVLGVAVSVTTVPPSKTFEHDVVRHCRPAGELVTMPLPEPALPTVRPYVGMVNCAVTFLAAVIET